MSSRSGRWLLGAGVAAATMFALLWGSSPPAPVGRGTPAPAFHLPIAGAGGREGEGGSLSIERLRGKVVLVNFWATWCKPCEDEMPAMQRMYRALAGSDFELVAISVDADEASVSEFARRLGLSFPILMDSSKQVASAYQAFRFPESLLVGRNGIILERYVGPKDWDADAYRDRVQRLLAEGAAG
jgi:peroxiredoxin